MLKGWNWRLEVPWKNTNSTRQGWFASYLGILVTLAQGHRTAASISYCRVHLNPNLIDYQNTSTYIWLSSGVRLGSHIDFFSRYRLIEAPDRLLHRHHTTFFFFFGLVPIFVILGVGSCVLTSETFSWGYPLCFVVRSYAFPQLRFREYISWQLHAREEMPRSDEAKLLGGYIHVNLFFFLSLLFFRSFTLRRQGKFAIYPTVHHQQWCSVFEYLRISGRNQGILHMEIFRCVCLHTCMEK